MKKLFLAMGLLVGSTAVPQQQSVNCECGRHETGITYFTVSSGQECCSGSPGPNAAITYYVQSEGVWKAVRTVPITGTAAQTGCCRPSS
jgi:hypothetical protein